MARKKNEPVIHVEQEEIEPRNMLGIPLSIAGNKL
jgi:hypothetical protein